MKALVIELRVSGMKYTLMTIMDPGVGRGRYCNDRERIECMYNWQSHFSFLELGWTAIMLKICECIAWGNFRWCFDFLYGIQKTENMLVAFNIWAWYILFEMYDWASCR